VRVGHESEARITAETRRPVEKRQIHGVYRGTAPSARIRLSVPMKKCKRLVGRDQHCAQAARGLQCDSTNHCSWVMKNAGSHYYRMKPMSCVGSSDRWATRRILLAHSKKREAPVWTCAARCSPTRKPQCRCHGSSVAAVTRRPDAGAVAQRPSGAVTTNSRPKDFRLRQVS
jgi:hypothetical protein